MALYKVEIDRSLCSGYGICAYLAPSVTELDDPPRRRSDRRRPTTPPLWPRQPNARWARTASSTPRARQQAA